MKSLARSFLLDPEDTPTVRLDTLGALVRAPAVVVTARTPVAEVRRLLAQRRVPAIAVVDAGRTLCGLVTRTDVLRTMDDTATAGDAMSGFVFALPATSAIEKAAALMAYEGVGQVVVTTADGELLGMVSAVDLARHFAIAAGYLVD